MTQVSSNTLALSQIFMQLADFYNKDSTGMFKDDSERLEAYSSLLKDLYEKVSKPLSYLDLYVKGEPPFSEKMNRFTQTFSKDINAITVDIDYLSAKTVNIFNMMKTEIDKEQKYLDRISSKSKILKMYNRSPSDDLIYYGDSFENADKIDITKIRQGTNPLISNGSASFSVSDSTDWLVTSVSVSGNQSLPKNGNNHEVKIGSSLDVDTSYKYVFEDSPNLGVITNIFDSNPLTSFECEVVNVNKTDASPYLNEKEFCYILEEGSVPNLSSGTLLNWSNYDMSDPLEVVVEMVSKRKTKANAIDISPFFSSMDLVEVSSVKVFAEDGSSEEVLHEPMFIGSSMAPFNLQNVNNYHYNNAVVRFSERILSEVQITFIQRTPKDIDLQHVYWVPDYQTDNNDDESPFYGLPRFNPEALPSETFEEVRFDYKSLLPTYSNPRLYKTQAGARKSVGVVTKKVPTVYSKHVIVLPMKLNFGSTEKDYYFDGWSGDEFTFSSELKLGPNYEGENVRYFDTANDASGDLQSIKDWLEDNGSDNGDGTYDFSAGSNTFTVDPTDITVTPFTRQFSESERYFTVPVKLEKEIYQAKRMAVGIRDISVYYESYNTEFEIISKPYVYNFPIDSLMLSVDSNIDNTFSTDLYLYYYISVNGGESWIRINPIQLDNQGIPEVISFNNNVPSDFELPGVMYLNYPDVPQAVDNVLVKITGTRLRGSNFTPEIKSYELIAKVKK